MTCGRRGVDLGDGIKDDQAYLIEEIVEVDDLKLFRLRNPYRTYDWKGDWSNYCDMWDTNCKMSFFCTWDDDNVNGDAFWIDWKDFVKVFNEVQVCDLTIVRDEKFDPGDQRNGLRVAGCCLCSLLDFWLCCDGFTKVYCDPAPPPDEEDPNLDIKYSVRCLLCENGP